MLPRLNSLMRLNKFLTCGCLVLASLMGAGNGIAQTIVLRLKNGDRLTGTLVRESTNEVVVSTSWAKDLAIPGIEITSREVIGTNLPAGPVSTSSIAGTKQTNTAVVATAKPKSKPKIAEKKSWHGKVDIGADLGFSEQNWQLYYGRGKITFAPQVEPGESKQITDRFKNTFDFQATYGRTDGTLSANRVDGTSKTDFDIGKKVFVYNLLGAGYDEIRKIDYQYEVGPGVGYHLIARSNLTLNTEFGVNYLFQRLDQPPNGESIERFSLRLAEEGTWTISRKLSLDQKLEFFPGLESPGDFRLRFEGNLRYSLWQSAAGHSLYLALTVLDIYESEPAAGVQKNDLQIRSSIGLSF